MEEIKPGTLICHSIEDKAYFSYFSKGKIHNNTYWEEGFRLGPKVSVLFLERLDLSPATSAALTAVVVRSMPAWTAAADWGEAKQEWENKKKIPGGIFLTPNAKKIWISHYDLKYFEEVYRSY